MTFHELNMFYLVGFAIAGILLYLRLHYRNRAKMELLGDSDMVRRMCASLSGRKRFIKMALRIAAMLLIVVAMARPKAGIKEETVEKSGIDVILSLDVSKSMLAKDSAPNRFERAKLELLSLLDRLGNDRVSLVLFSGGAFVQMPLTLDYSAARLFIKSASIDTLPKPGTTGAAVIDKCVDVFKRVKGRTKAVVMFTDGEFHDVAFLRAGERAKEAGIAIFAVSLGTEKGGPIPVTMKGGVTDFKKDKKGNVVLTKVGKNNLVEITRTTGGEYYSVADERIIERIANSFRTLDQKATRETIYSQFEEKFEWPLMLAGLLLILEAALSDRKKKSGA